jgi:hypothetical protein
MVSRMIRVLDAAEPKVPDEIMGPILRSETRLSHGKILHICSAPPNLARRV